MDRIGDNGVSLEFSRILQLLNSSQLFQKLHSGRTIKQLLPNDTTSKSMGFISQISRILVAFDDGSRIPIIVKIPELHTITHSMVLICGEKERNFMRENGSDQLYRFIAEYFNRECAFYETLTDWPDVKKATAYATEPWRYGDASSCGSVIMRDLSAQAEPSNIYNGLNPSQLLEILSQIAWIQVHGLRSKTPYIRLSDGYMEFFYKMQEPASTWTTLEPKIGPEFEKIQHLYKNRHFWHYVFRESHKDLGIPDVICHGDMWAYNFLWNKVKTQNGDDSLSALLDWQNVHHGSCAEDLCHLFVFGCDAEERRVAEAKFLPILHEMIVERSAKVGIDVPYSFEQLDKAYRIHLVAQGSHFAFIGRVMDTMDGLSVEEEKHEILVKRVHGALIDASKALAKSLPQYLPKFTEL